MVFCNKYLDEEIKDSEYVTILILIDGFLQFVARKGVNNEFRTSQSLF